MPSTTKRRRSGRDMEEENKEEEELASALFGAKKTRRTSDMNEVELDNEEDEDQGPSNHRVNAEQHLDDDQVCVERKRMQLDILPDL